MPKRSGRRKLSHSTKKVQRRSGSGLVRCKKSKRKVHLHPGKAKMGNNTPALRRAAREAKRNPDPDAMDTGDKKKEPDATAARREARQSMGKQLREQELAKRRGLARQMGGGGLDDDLPDGGEDGGEGAEDAGAFTVGRPLAQKAFERELSKVLQASDILVEVLDARDPLGCRCKPLDSCQNSGGTFAPSPGTCSSPRILPCCKKTALFFEFPLCLSRAWLGKITILM